jgi:hypothetical protein
MQTEQDNRSSVFQNVRNLLLCLNSQGFTETDNVRIDFESHERLILNLSAITGKMAGELSCGDAGDAVMLYLPYLGLAAGAPDKQQYQVEFADWKIEVEKQ